MSITNSEVVNKTYLFRHNVIREGDHFKNIKPSWQTYARKRGLKLKHRRLISVSYICVLLPPWNQIRKRKSNTEVRDDFDIPFELFTVRRRSFYRCALGFPVYDFSQSTVLSTLFCQEIHRGFSIYGRTNRSIRYWFSWDIPVKSRFVNEGKSNFFELDICRNAYSSVGITKNWWFCLLKVYNNNLKRFIVFNIFRHIIIFYNRQTIIIWVTNKFWLYTCQMLLIFW